MKTVHCEVVWFVFAVLGFASGGLTGARVPLDSRETLAEDSVGGNRTGTGYSDVYVNKDVSSRFGRGSKDSMLPLLSGVVLKLLLIVPLFLATLGLVAGFSLATSKVALLLGGGLSLYYYLRDYQVLTPLTKQWEDSSHSHSYPPELPEHFHRDRLSFRRIALRT